MSKPDPHNQPLQAPAAVIKPGHGLSIIWVVPIVALLIAGWLAMQAWSEQGPEITITFETAEGLEAGKTKIKFKEVEIGKVTDITLSADLGQVVVTAEMNKAASGYLREATQFWVVRARVAAGEVSGLGTLFSGAYIGCNPSTEGPFADQFTGLEKPPVITTGLSGRHFTLESMDLGSLDVGSPVYYRGIKVGQVVDYGFDPNAELVDVNVFINSPYHEKVHQNSRFWNASGVDFKIDTEGVNIDTQSLVSIMLGGIAFDLPAHLEPLDQAEENQRFRLYQSREKIEEQIYTVRQYYLMYFDQNVRGLLPGAPVEMRGLRIGEVKNISLEVDVEATTARVAVLVLVEPERIDTLVDGKKTEKGTLKSADQQQMQETLAQLVAKGMRAQLKNGNLLTGQLYIDLDFFADAPPAEIHQQNGTLVMPTLPAPFEQIAQRVNSILKKVERMPLEEISEELRSSLRSFNATLKQAEQVAGGVNQDLLPELKLSLQQFQQTMSGVGQTLGPDSALNYSARNVLMEMNTTIRSLRALIDSLERNPQSLLFGKEEQ